MRISIALNAVECIFPLVRGCVSTFSAGTRCGGLIAVGYVKTVIVKILLSCLWEWGWTRGQSGSCAFKSKVWRLGLQSCKHWAYFSSPPVWITTVLQFWLPWNANFDLNNWNRIMCPEYLHTCKEYSTCNFEVVLQLDTKKKIKTGWNQVCLRHLGKHGN